MPDSSPDFEFREDHHDVAGSASRSTVEYDEKLGLLDPHFPHSAPCATTASSRARWAILSLVLSNTISIAYSTMDGYYNLLNQLNGTQKRELPTDPGWNMEHLNHCWDYLRQNIMCSADVTLEWHRYNELVETGWGYEHQCKDWDAIIDWVYEHRTSNNWGILRGQGERIPLE
ncbi:hypothetical protein DL766_004724 [Monosporascus sp. MC13-8B]|uniref:Uncharacterized protein n=1 Tax=Monosporascus cannonballus TaxID=155416 RepID=A0ABY0H3Q4_9PEZI|nr:hypothetical protein DL762_007117 [Monosporascus cannonballus]RYP01322.1 hypothetical protein DL763_000294 [Monosporascus cannonballus]RYP30776.1 hypothetical protein DL766_004724 [Monosporascus sp. MC13-8B]